MSNEKSTHHRETEAVDPPGREVSELSEEELSAVAGGVGLTLGVLPPDPCIGQAAQKTVQLQPFNITKKLDKSAP
jgi:hypothetical protein